MVICNSVTLETDRWMRPGLSVFILIMLAACAPRVTAERAAPHPAAEIQPIFVATGRDLDRTGPIFGLERPQKVNYFRADVSVPPTHETGRIEWPDGPPDAATDFVVTGTRVYDGPRSLTRDMRARTEGRETLLYVHGYNNTLSEAMYRLAQIRADFNVSMPGLLFAWPSAGDPRGRPPRFACSTASSRRRGAWGRDLYAIWPCRCPPRAMWNPERGLTLGAARV